jgi:hypothetical protein
MNEIIDAAAADEQAFDDMMTEGRMRRLLVDTDPTACPHMNVTIKGDEDTDTVSSCVCGDCGVALGRRPEGDHYEYYVIN